MRRRDRGAPQFSLSFLDCMSCGLGAVVLLFMIIHHATTVRATERHRDVATEVSQLETEVLEQRDAVAERAAALERTEREIAAAEARAASLERRVSQEIPEVENDGSDDRIAVLQRELVTLEKEVEALREQDGDATRTFTGDGKRQYLTGLRVDGRHVLVLVDTSASMLGETIVDVIRRRNMSVAKRRAAPKWRRAIATVDWITTQVPSGARFQLLAFAEETRAVLDGTDGRWLETGGGRRLGEAVDRLRDVVPGGGTSLAKAFAAAAKLSPRPDAVYLVTDGLPTQGASGTTKGTVTSNQRLRFHRQALDALPRGVPVNVILFPIEGDPLAASAFWQLAQVSGGAFLSPSEDWP